jgi:hypothetical protein
LMISLQQQQQQRHVCTLELQHTSRGRHNIQH